MLYYYENDRENKNLLTLRETLIEGFELISQVKSMNKIKGSEMID